MFRQFRVSRSKRTLKSITALVLSAMLCQIAMVPQAIARELNRLESERARSEAEREERLGLNDWLQPEMRGVSIQRAVRTVADEMRSGRRGLSATEIKGDVERLMELAQSDSDWRMDRIVRTRAQLAQLGLSPEISERLNEYERQVLQRTTKSMQLLRQAQLTSSGSSAGRMTASLLEHFEIRADVEPDATHLPHARQRKPQKAIGMAPVFEYPWKLADASGMFVISDLFDGLGQDVTVVSGPPGDSDLAIAAPDIVFDEADCNDPSDCGLGSDPIRCLVEELGCDPVKLYEHVRNEYAYEFYFGAMKGARRTLEEGTGNDLDLASLLIAMLRSAGVPARYVFGTIEMSVEDGLAWSGVSDAIELVQLMVDAGIPVEYDAEEGVIRKDHVWVRAYMDVFPYRGGTSVPDTWIDLDPSFKQHTFVGDDIADQFNLSPATVLANAQIDATIATDSVIGLDDSGAIGQLRALAEPIRDYLVDRGLTAEDVFWQRIVSEERFGIVPITDLYRIDDTGVSTTAVPEVLKHKITFEVEDPVTDVVWMDSNELNLVDLVGAQIDIRYILDDLSYPVLAAMQHGPLSPDDTELLRFRPRLEIDGVPVAFTVDETLGAIPGKLQRLKITIDAPGETHAPIIDPIMVGGIHSFVIDAQSVTGEDLSEVASTLESIEFDSSLHQELGVSKTIGATLSAVGKAYFHEMDRYNRMIAGSLGVVTSRQPSIARVSWELDVPDPSYFHAVRGGDVTVRVLRDVHVAALAVGTPETDDELGPDDQFFLTSAMTSNAAEASALKLVLGSGHLADPTMDPLGDHGSVVRLLAHVMRTGRTDTGTDWRVITSDDPNIDTQITSLPSALRDKISIAIASGHEVTFNFSPIDIAVNSGTQSTEKWYALLQRDIETNATSYSLLDEDGIHFSSGRFMVRGTPGDEAPRIFELFRYNSENHALYESIVDNAIAGALNTENATTNAALWFMPAVVHVNDWYMPYAESRVSAGGDIDPIIPPLAAMLVSAPIDQATEEPAILNLASQSLNDANPYWLRTATTEDPDADQLRVTADVTRGANWTLTVYDSGGTALNTDTGSSTRVDVVIDASDMSLDSGTYSYELSAIHPNTAIEAVPVEGTFRADFGIPTGSIESAQAVSFGTSDYGPGILQVYGYADDEQSFSRYEIYLGGNSVPAYSSQIPFPDPSPSSSYQRLATIDTTSLGSGTSMTDLELRVYDSAGNAYSYIESNVTVKNPRDADTSDPEFDEAKLYANGIELTPVTTDEYGLISDGNLEISFAVHDNWTVGDEEGILRKIEVFLDAESVWSKTFSDFESPSHYTAGTQDVPLGPSGLKLYPEMLTNGSHVIAVVATDHVGNSVTQLLGFETSEAFSELRLEPRIATPTQPVLHLTGNATEDGWSAKWDENNQLKTLNPGAARVSGSIDEFFDTTVITSDGEYVLEFFGPSGGAAQAKLPFKVDRDRQPVAVLTGLADISAADSATTASELTDVPGVTKVQDGLLKLLGRAYDAAASLNDSSIIEMSLTLIGQQSEAENYYFSPPSMGDQLWSPTTAEVWHQLTTPGIGRVNPVEIARLDLSGLPDGLYDVKLQVRVGGTSPTIAEDIRPLSISSPLKVGQFKFSQQDVSVPVQGLPLSLVRTYDSQRAAIDGPFGKGWQFSLYDLDVQIDERRVDAEPDTTLDALDATIREVDNGMFNRNVTLTLPDGRRVTFGMRLKSFNMGLEFKPYYETPPGVSATLTPIGANGQILELTPFPTLHWKSEGYGVPEAFFDFAGWDLELDDGTIFRIRRPAEALGVTSTTLTVPNGDASITALYGEPYLASVRLASGEELEFFYTSDPNATDEYKYVKSIKTIPVDGSDSLAERSMSFEYDAANRISAVYIGSDTTGVPAYMYAYTGDLLTTVRRVRDESPPNPTEPFAWTDSQEHDDTFFYYQDGVIERIEDPRGLSPVITEYRDDGRVAKITDAYGQETRFEYDLENSTQTVYNPDGTSVYYEYDDLGNVTLEEHSTGKRIVRNYEGTLLVSEHDSTREYPTKYEYNSRDEIVRTEDPLGNVTRREITYHSTGSPNLIRTIVESRDPSVPDIINEQQFDQAGNLIRTVSGETVTENQYDNSNRISETYVTNVDENGVVSGLRLQTSYEYNGGRLENVTQHNDTGNIVQTFKYDDYGNQVLSYTYRGSNYVGTYTLYDRAQRAVGTWQYDSSSEPEVDEDPDIELGYTKLTSTYYNGVDQVVMTIDHRAGTSSTTRYDRRGNVIETAQWPVDLSEGLNASELNSLIDWFKAVKSTSTNPPLPSTVNPASDTPVVSRTHYNDQGQAQVVTDQFLAPSYPDLPTGNIYGSVTMYLSNGAVQSSYRVDSARVDIAFHTDSNDYGIATELPPGTPPEEYDLGNTEPGSRTDSHYDALGRVEYTVSGANDDDNQLRTEYTYDDNDRQKEVTLLAVDDESPVRFTSKYEYDAAGRRSSAEDPSGNIVRYRYDDLGRLTHTLVNDPIVGEVATRTIYDALGRRSKTVDQLGQERTFKYDQSSRLEQVVLPEVIDPGTDLFSPGDDVLVKPTYSYDYDNDGNLTQIIDPNAATTGLTYDYLGRRKTRMLPGVQSTPTGDLGTGDRIEEWFYYDSTTTATGEWPNQLRAHRDFNGNFTYFTYDLEGRLDTRAHYTAASTSTYLPGSVSGPPFATPQTAYTFSYDAFGRQDAVSYALNGNSNGATSYMYDDDGRLMSVNSPTGIVSYTYFGNGSLKSINDGTDTTWYTYDAFGRLKTVSDEATQNSPSANTWRYEYDDVGNRSELTRPDGGKTTYTYDTLHRLTRLVNTDAGGSVLSEYRYTLRADGRRTRVVDLRQESMGNYSAVAVDYQYDALNRLTAESWSTSASLDIGTDPSPGTLQERTGVAYKTAISYTYDAAGNRRLKVVDGPTTDSYVVYTYAADDSDRLWTETHYTGTPGSGTEDEVINYRWDSNGFLIHKFSSSDDEQYTANAEGKLAAYLKDSVTTTFAYDHAGERLSATNSTRTITDLVDRANPTGYSQILKRTDSLGQYSFTNILGDDLLAQDDGPTLQHLLYDGHGSTRLLYNTEVMTPGIQESYDYDAYGNAVEFDQSTAGTNYLYTGEQADLALGDSYYLRARFYMPGPAMFTSLDPYFGDTGEPQSLHKYAYVHGDPINAWDPSGMFGIVQTIAVNGFIRGMFWGIRTSPLGIYLSTVFSGAIQLRGLAIVDAIIHELERTLSILMKYQRSPSVDANNATFINYINTVTDTLDNIRLRGNIGKALFVITPLLAALPPVYVLALGLFRANDAINGVALALAMLAAIGPAITAATANRADLNIQIVPRSQYIVGPLMFFGIIEPTGVIRTANDLLELMLNPLNRGAVLPNEITPLLQATNALKEQLDDVASSGYIRGTIMGVQVDQSF